MPGDDFSWQTHTSKTRDQVQSLSQTNVDMLFQMSTLVWHQTLCNGPHSETVNDRGKTLGSDDFPGHMNHKAKVDIPWVILDLYDEPEKDFIFVLVCSPRERRQTSLRANSGRIRHCQGTISHGKPTQARLETKFKVCHRPMLICSFR